MKLIIYWEDSPNMGLIHEFGPDRLLKQCLIDNVGENHRERVEKIQSIPKKGNGNLAADLRSVSVRAIGVFDFPEVTRLDSKKKLRCMRDTKAQLFGDIVANGQRIVFLVRKLETVIETLEQLSPGLVTQEAWDGAKRKNLNDRDLVLKKAARAENRVVRDGLRSRMSSFDYLVCQVQSLLF